MDNPAPPSPGVALPTEGTHPSPPQRGATLTLIGLWLIPTVLIAAVISAFYINARFSNLWAVIAGFLSGSGLVALVQRVVSWAWGHLLPDTALKRLGEAIRTYLNLLWQRANQRVVIVSSIVLLLLAVILPFIGLPQVFDPYTQRSWQTQSISFASWPSEGFCGSSNGGYQVRADLVTVNVMQQKQQRPSFTGCFMDTLYKNIVYEAHMIITNGDCGGLLFRAQEQLEHPHMFFFDVCQNGRYGLYPFYDGPRPGMFTAPTCTHPDGTMSQCNLAESSAGAIHKGVCPSNLLNRSECPSNLLAVVADGSTLKLYVNRVPLATIENQPFLDGHIGVAANATSDPTTVIFSNMKVWTL